MGYEYFFCHFRWRKKLRNIKDVLDAVLACESECSELSDGDDDWANFSSNDNADDDSDTDSNAALNVNRLTAGGCALDDEPLATIALRNRPAEQSTSNSGGTEKYVFASDQHFMTAAAVEFVSGAPGQ